MAFVDRESKYPGRVRIDPENGSSSFYAMLTRADAPTVAGTPLNAAALNELINRYGDTMRAQLVFENPESYHALTKFREIEGSRYQVNFGCGVLGGKGVVAFEVRSGSESTAPRLGRLEVGELGVSYINSAGKRTYLIESGVVDAEVV